MERKESFTDDENKQIDKIRLSIELMFTLKNVKPAHGITAISEIIILAFANMVSMGSLTEQEAISHFEKLLDGMKIHGVEIIKMAADKENNKTKTSREAAFETFLNPDLFRGSKH